MKPKPRLGPDVPPSLLPSARGSYMFSFVIPYLKGRDTDVNWKGYEGEWEANYTNNKASRPRDERLHRTQISLARF